MMLRRNIDLLVYHDRRDFHLPTLTKEEVDTYFNENYKALASKIRRYCYKHALSANEILAEWYIYLLKCEQQCEKYYILSKRGLMYFVTAYQADKIMKRKNILKKPLMLISDYKGYEPLIESTVVEDLIKQEEIKELYKKVKKLKVPIGYNRAKKEPAKIVSAKILINTFHELMKEKKGRGTRQAANLRKFRLVEKLREAYNL